MAASIPITRDAVGCRWAQRNAPRTTPEQPVGEPAVHDEVGAIRSAHGHPARWRFTAQRRSRAAIAWRPGPECQFLQGGV